MQVGIGVGEDLPIAEQQALARLVEEGGFASLWTNEARGRDAMLVCQAWAQATDTLQVGIGVAPLWTRTPVQLAMAAATLQEASRDRLLLGLGVSHPATMSAWHGADYRRPLTAAREALELLRHVLAGGTTDHPGEVLSSRRFALEITPLPPAPRLYLAAMGPRMLTLAGERADGALLNWSSPTEVQQAAARVRGAAAGSEHGRRPSEVKIAAYVRIAVADNRDAARRALAREIGRYCALPAYAQHLARQGFSEAVEAAKAAYTAGGPDAAADALPEGVIQQLGWYGTPDDSIRALSRYATTGLDHLIARVVVVGDDPVGSVRAVLAALEDLPR